MDTSQATQAQSGSQAEDQDINVDLNAGLQNTAPPPPQGSPMISPDNTDARVIPAEHQDSATQAGWQPAVKVVHPVTRDARWIPTSQADAATQAGYQRSDIPVALTSKPGEQFQGLGSALWDRATGIVTGTGVIGAARDVYQQAAEAPRLYQVFKEARQKGADITTAISAANEEAKRFNDAHDTIKNLAEEYEKTPNKALWGNIIDMALMGAAGKATEPAIAEGSEAATAEGATAKAATVPAPGRLKPGYVNVADNAIPVRAEGPIAKAAETVVNPSKLREFEVTKTQPAVRQAAANIAADVADTESPTQVPGKADAFGFGQASGDVAARTQPRFQKLDELSGGEFSKAQNEADLARSSLDFEGKKAYQAALEKQNGLFTKHASAFPDEDLQQMKADWRQKSGLDELATRFNRSVGPTPSELTTPGKPDIGYVNPKQFRNSIIDAVQNGEFDKAGFTPEHVQALEDLGRILDKAQVSTGLNATLGSVAKYLGRRAVGSAVGGIVGGVPGAIVGAVAEHGAEYLAGKIFGRRDD